MIKTFAITSMRRSGTKFLSQLLNKSVYLTVKHEPGKNPKEKWDKKKIVERFKYSESNYGEANSYLRRCFDRIPASKKAILLRDPWNIVVSAFNKKGGRISRILI